jgi:hypothetical protein
MFRVLMMSLSLALLAPPVAALADGNGNGKGNNHGDNGKNNGKDGGKHDNGNHYGNGDNKHYEPQRYAWQGSPNDNSSWKNYRNYSYYRPAPGQTRYYANQYYRDGSYYRPRYVAANERIYRGQDNR